MPECFSGETGQIGNAFERLLRGELSRRDFIKVAIQGGISAGMAATMAGASQTAQAKHMARERPNILLILADDMGFSDLGVMDSEIRTPYIDSIAQGGALLTSMYNAARCCPSRAALLTGMYPHKAGIGHPGEVHNITVFTETRGVTRTSITVLYESKEARDTARRSGMEYGMAAGYDRLESLLPAFGDN